MDPGFLPIGILFDETGETESDQRIRGFSALCYRNSQKLDLLSSKTNQKDIKNGLTAHGLGFSL